MTTPIAVAIPRMNPSRNCATSAIQPRFPVLPGERPTVLLVEDTDEVRTVLAAFLEKEGFSVTAVATDRFGASVSRPATVQVGNVAPTITSVTLTAFRAKILSIIWR